MGEYVRVKPSICTFIRSIHRSTHPVLTTPYHTIPQINQQILYQVISDICHSMYGHGLGA